MGLKNVNDIKIRESIRTVLGCKRSLVRIQSRRPSKYLEITEKINLTGHSNSKQLLAVIGQYRPFLAIGIKRKLGDTGHSCEATIMPRFFSINGTNFNREVSREVV